jgi:hypothetical protein
MITVENIIEKNAQKSIEVAKENEELLNTGAVSKAKKPIWPWILLAATAIGVGWYFLRKKGSGTNEGTSGQH